MSETDFARDSAEKVECGNWREVNEYSDGSKKITVGISIKTLSVREYLPDGSLK